MTSQSGPAASMFSGSSNCARWSCTHSLRRATSCRVAMLITAPQMLRARPQAPHVDPRLQGDPDVDLLPQRRLEGCLLLLQGLIEFSPLRRQALQQLRYLLLGGVARRLLRRRCRHCIMVCQGRWL